MKPCLLTAARLPLPLASAIAALLAATAATATPYDWTGATNGTWNTTTNWSGGSIPLITDDLTILGPLNVAGALNINFNADNSAKSLIFTNTAATSITNTTSGSLKTLTLGSGGITTGAGAVQIGANVAGQGVNINLGAAQTWNIGAGGMTVANVISGAATGITKTGAGNLTINSSAVNSFTGGLNANGGTVTLDYTNLAAPTNLIAATNALQFNKGALTITGKATGTTAQTFAGTTIGAGVNNVTINRNSGTSATLNLGALTLNSASSLIFNPATTWTTTASATEIVNITAGGSVPSLPVSGTAFFNAGVFVRNTPGAAGSLRPVAVNSSGQLLQKANAGNLAVGTGVDPTGYYQLSAGSIALTNTGASVYGILLNATGAGTNITIANSGTLTLNSVIQIKATESVNIVAGTGVSNLVIGAEKNLVLAVDNNAGVAISAPIANNGSTGGTGGTASAVTIVAGLGTGGVTLSGANTYSGVTTVDGTLVTGSRTVLAVNHNNALGTTAGGTVLIGGVAASGDGARITLANGVTVTGETLTIRTGGVGTRSTLTQATSSTSAWHGNIVVDANEGFGQIFANTSSVMTIGANATNTFILNGSQTLRGTGAGTVNSTISGTGDLQKTDAGTWTLSAANSYTGATNISSTGSLILANVSALGGNNPGVNGTSAINMTTGSILRPSITGVTVFAPITATGTVTIGAPSVGSQAFTDGVLTLAGAITGSGNVTFNSIQNVNNNNNILLTAQSSYLGSTLMQTSSTSGTNTAHQIVVRLGIDDALPTTTVLTIDGGLGTGSGRVAEFVMNGYDQTLAGLSNVTRSLRVQRVVNSNVSAASTLTINGSVDSTFGGTIGLNSAANSMSAVNFPGGTNGNNILLTKDGSGTFTLTGANLFSGRTLISGGILSLGNASALSQSPLDTLNSVTGDATNGLRTTVTTLTLGGLTGGNDFSTRFTTTTGGYTGLTALTLNPVSLASHSYGGDIGDGATGMNLIKTGAGTQTLTGTNTHTGTTTVSAGVLAVNGTLANTSTTTVSGTGTLKGSGSINSSVTINSGGTLASGNSIESLAVGGDLSFNTGSSFQYELDKDVAATVAGDLTAVTGNLSLTGTVTLNLLETGTGAWELGNPLGDHLLGSPAADKLTLISYTGTWNGGLFTYLGNLVQDDSSIMLNGQRWWFNYNDTDAGTNFTGDLTGSSFVTMTVPEPDAAALLGCLGALALFRRRRN